MTAIVTTAFAVALWLGGGIVALLYVPVFAAAALPGIPIGISLFGRSHPAAWLGGALLGYGLTQITLWAVIAAGVASPIAFVIAWMILAAAAFAITRRSGNTPPALTTPVWHPTDTRALLLVLLLVPVLMGITYRNLGREDADGNRYYRAYFTADFVWHSALAYELGKFSLPPRNPYLAPRPMNYYWTYFLLPASTARLAPPSAPGAQDVQQYLKANAILAGALMIGMLFVFVRSGTSSAVAAGLAVTLAVVAASAEGTYAVLDLRMHERPMRTLLDINVDAVTGWAPFNGLRIDNIPRSLWYTPQHTTSLALGLLALTMIVIMGSRAGLAAIAGAGLSLGLATTMNPLLGAVCSLLYGACVLADAVATGSGISAIARHALAAGVVAVAVLWGSVSQVMAGAGSALDFGFKGFSRHWPVITLLLSLGPVLLPALFGVVRVRDDRSRRAVIVGLSGIAVGLFLLYLVRISEASWMGFRAGQILLVCIPMLLARTFEWLPAPGRAALASVILLVGLPTTVIDTYNAQDIGNRRQGPGFRWTLWTTPAQEQAFAWIRQNTTDRDIVQMEPMVRGREHWTLIPSFAGRRMAAGLPISLLPIPDYQERSEQVRTIFASIDASAAAATAHRMRLDYLYVDQADVTAYPDGVAKFDAHPESFEKVFSNTEVRVYRVR